MYTDMFRLLFTVLLWSVCQRVFSIISSGTHFLEGSSAFDMSSAPVSSQQFFTNALPKCCPDGQRLNERMEHCEVDYPSIFTPSLHLEWLGVNDVGPHVVCAPGNTLRLPAVKATSRAYPLANGSLVFRVHTISGAYREITLRREEFCVDVVGTSEAWRPGPTPWALLVCPCEYEVCIRKCCPQRQILVVQEIAEGNVFVSCEEAAPGELTWQPVFDDIPSAPHEALLGAWPPGCEQGVMRAPPGWADPKPGVRTVSLQSNGSAVVAYRHPLEIQVFCLDFERNRHGVLTESIVHCASPLEAPFVDKVMSGVSAVGGVALLLVLVTYALLPELRASAFGRALICYTSSLLLSMVVGIWWALVPAISSFRCVFTLMWNQFFLIASAFWLNAMCFDMGIAFSLFQWSWARNSSVDRRFIRYSIYAWGGPFAISVVTLAMQLALPYGHPCRPVEWYMGCKYFTPTAQFLFFYAPTLIMLVSNLILLIYVAWCIRKLLKSRRILEIPSDSSNICPYTGKKRMLLFTRLLWAMGVVETGIEIITWAAVSHFTHWHVTNVVDLSRALCLFAQVCCKRRVLVRLRQRIKSPTESSDTHRFNRRVEPRHTGTISSSALSTTRNTSHNTDSSCRSTNNCMSLAKASVGMGDIELQDMKTLNGGQNMADDHNMAVRRRSEDGGQKNHVDGDKMSAKTESIPASGIVQVDSVPRSPDDVSSYAVPKRENSSSQQNDSTFQHDVKNSTHKKGSSNENIDDSSLELGDLSNSASNSPLAKSFPLDNTASLMEKKIVESSDEKPVRPFRRSASKVTVNPTFETPIKPNKQAKSEHKVQEDGSQVPELSIVDDTALLNNCGNDVIGYPVGVPRNRDAVSVTSL